MDSVMDSPNRKGKCGAQAAAPAGPERLDVGDLRQQLAEKKGPEFWRSLDELAETPEFGEMLHREFPRHASEWPEGFSRRRFLQLSSASLALAGLTGCTRQPIEKIVPYVRQPEQIIPGKPLFFATALTLGGYATGVLAESHTGRPTKIEGNPDHPASLGATDVFAQASILTLYDPDRSQTLLHNGRPGTWGGFVGEMTATLRSLQPLGGEGLRILTGTVTSPTLAAQVQALLTAFPRARWHRWEPAAPHQARAAARRAFGTPLETVYDFTQADVVVSVDSDTLCQGPAGVRYSHDFAARRRVRTGTQAMNRLYAVESVPTNSSTIADHRLQLPPDQLEAFLLALAQAVGVPGVAGANLTDPKAQKWVQAVSADLRAHAGRSVVAADEYLSTAAQVLVHGINQALGNVGRTVNFIAPVEADPVDHVQSIRELVADMSAGRVDTLLMLDGVNPVYTAPADLRFADALQKVRLRVHHGLYQDETSGYCQWHVNAAHELESWSDARSYDGTVSILQPLIDPLFEGRTAHEVLSALANRPDSTSYDVVREYWAKYGATLLTGPDGSFDSGWRRALNSGIVPAGVPPVAPTATVSGGAVAQAAAEISAALAARKSGTGRVTLLFRPDPTVWDGRFSSNAWLQELPKPITKLAWDNALLLSPRTAERLKVSYYETVTLAAGGRELKDVAVWILPGMADDTAQLSLGYGRTTAGKGTGRGFNAYALRTSNSLWTLPDVEVRPQGGRYEMACTQNHHLIGQEVNEDAEATEAAKRRHVIRTGTLEEFRANPNFLLEEREKPADDMTMFPPHKYEGHAWGMAIDLGLCTGCSSCVVACQSENNIPVVGKEQVLARPRDALAAHRPLLRGRPRRAHDPPPAAPLHALRERAVRGGLPGGRHRAQRRGVERHGLQPVRGHPVLLEQLPLQGAALQLPALRPDGRPAPRHGHEPGRDGAHARRHGEVHLLRAAHRAGQDRVQGGRPAHGGQPGEDRLPAGLPHRRHHLRRPERRGLGGHPVEERPALPTACWRSSTRARAPPTWPSCATPTPRWNPRPQRTAKGSEHGHA